MPGWDAYYCSTFEEGRVQKHGSANPLPLTAVSAMRTGWTTGSTVVLCRCCGRGPIHAAADSDRNDPAPRQRDLDLA